MCPQPTTGLFSIFLLDYLLKEWTDQKGRDHLSLCRTTERPRSPCDIKHPIYRDSTVYPTFSHHVGEEKRYQGQIQREASRNLQTHRHGEGEASDKTVRKAGSETGPKASAEARLWIACNEGTTDSHRQMQGKS